MHKRARGHEAEPVTPIFLCPKTKRSKTREKGATGESYAQTCKRTRGRAQSLPFFMSKNEKQGKNGRKTQLERVMHEGARGHEAEPKNSHFLCPKTKRSKTREKGATGESHAPTCKRTRGRAQSLHFLYSTTERNYNQRIMGFIRNIMRRYVRISSFFVQKCGEEMRNVRPIQGRTEILRLYFYFSGKIDWKIKDIFLKKENLKGLSTYIYGEKYCLTCKTVWVQFKTVLRRQ